MSVKKIGKHTISFSWFLGNHSDYQLYLTIDPEKLRKKQYGNNPHILAVPLGCMPEKTREQLVTLCLNGLSLQEAQELYKKFFQKSKKTPSWYVIVHIIFNETQDSLGYIDHTASNVMLESSHSFQYLDGYMYPSSTDNCMEK